MEAIRQLEDWFTSQCNDDWEHQYGITIATLDNPGWSLKIDLTGTALQDMPLDEIKRDRSDSDWIVARRNGRIFEAFGGHHNLGELISTFLEWAGSPQFSIN